MSICDQKPGLTSIVAVGLSGEIGIKNALPWKLKSDLRHFKATTLDNIVIMGRKTYESIGDCLPKRENLVLSHRQVLFHEHQGCRHTHSVGETLWHRQRLGHKRAYVIGGALTYEQFAPFVDRYLVTIVKSRFPAADAYFNADVIGDLADWSHQEVPVDRVAEPGADEFDFTVIEFSHNRPEEIAEARRAEVAEFEGRNHLFRRKQIKRYANNGQTLDQILAMA